MQNGILIGLLLNILAMSPTLKIGVAWLSFHCLGYLPLFKHWLEKVVAAIFVVVYDTFVTGTVLVTSVRVEKPQIVLKICCLQLMYVAINLIKISPISQNLDHNFNFASQRSKIYRASDCMDTKVALQECLVFSF